MTASRVTIVVDSRYGSTLSLAKAIVEGAESEGAEVRLRRVEISCLLYTSPSPRD